MKPPEWQQRVLLTTDDPEVRLAIASAFGAETQLVLAKDSVEALTALESGQFQVLIVDTSASDPKLHYSEEKKGVSFLELVQVGVQVNQGLTVVLLTNKLLLKEGKFTRKSGASLIMDRKSISISRLVYVIRVFRKRTFRTILLRDLRPGDVLPADLYHFLPANNRYTLFLPALDALTQEKFNKLVALNAHHLYVRNAEFPGVIAFLGLARSGSTISENLGMARDQFQNTLRNIFDLSTDGNIGEGKNIYNSVREVVQRLDGLISLYASPVECLRELLYPRWSAIAHGINSAILSLIFARQCGIAEATEIAWAALIHNIGLADVKQSILAKSELKMDQAEMEEYKRHVEKAIELLRLKQIPVSPLIEEAILHHHECFDGSGFPDGLAGVNLTPAAGLLAIVGSFDHLLAQRPGEKVSTPLDAWKNLLRLQEEGSAFKKKFHPELLKKIDPLFLS